MIADRSAYGFSKTLEELIWNVESGKATRRGILLPGKLVLGVGPYSARFSDTQHPQSWMLSSNTANFLRNYATALLNMAAWQRTALP